MQQNKVNEICITEKFPQVMLKPTTNFHDVLPHCLCHVTWVVKHIPHAMSPNRTLFKHHGKSLDWPVQHTVEQAICCTTVTDQAVCKRMWRKILLSSKFWHGTQELCKRVWGNASLEDVGKPDWEAWVWTNIWIQKSRDMRNEWLAMDSRQKYKTCSMINRYGYLVNNTTSFLMFPLQSFEFVDGALTSVRNSEMCHPRCVCK